MTTELGIRRGERGVEGPKGADMATQARNDRNAASMMALCVAVGAFLIAALGLVAASSGAGTAVDSGSTGPISVGLSEFAITPAAMTASAGTVELQITNTGTQVHNLEGATINPKSADIAPGGSTTMTLTDVA